MMKKTVFVLVCTLLVTCQSLLWAASENQLAAISKAGELNGIALQCRFLEQTQRLKRAMVLNLPRERKLGEWFDVNTNLSFMDFMSSKSVCPDEHSFRSQVDNCIKQIEFAFKE